MDPRVADLERAIEVARLQLADTARARTFASRADYCLWRERVKSRVKHLREEMEKILGEEKRP